MNPKFIFFALLSTLLLALTVKPAPSRPLYYQALVNQFIVGIPSADEVYIDTLGATLTFTRQEVGHYVIHADPCIFAGGKTFTQATPAWGSPGIIGITQMNDCEVWYETHQVIGGEMILSDNSGVMVAITVYP